MNGIDLSICILNGHFELLPIKVNKFIRKRIGRSLDYNAIVNNKKG
jgi:hypothetical protein